MRQKLLLFGLLGMIGATVLAQPQYKIQFSYDSAGNQTLRDRVCVNCETLKAAIDTTAVVNVALQDDILEEISGLDKEEATSTIVAYPNPVTDILTIEWLANENDVKQVVLFSSINQQLRSDKIRPDQRQLELSFGNYPPGMYIVLVLYADNSKQSFQVIKK